MNKRGMNKTFIIIIIAIIAILAVYFTFFFYYKCTDIGCFKAHQEKCSKTKFINDAQDATWSYAIKGKSSGQCKIEVELVQIKQGEKTLETLEGNKMLCYLPLGNTANPETDLSKCHGLLKEELQETIINKLHAYILKNVGEISEELKGVV